MVWIYRPGAYYNVEVKRSLEVLEAHDVEPFTAGKPKLLDGVDLTKKTRGGVKIFGSSKLHREGDLVSFG
jgi:hypothetical protein